MRSTSSRGSNGLDEIVVGALLEPVDAVLGLGHRGQQQHRHPALAAQARVRSSPLSPGIITSSTTRSKAKLASLARASAASAATVTRNPLSDEIAAQQLAQPRIVVDDEEMRFELAHAAGIIPCGGAQGFIAVTGANRRRSSASAMMPSSTLRKPSTAGAPAWR